MRRSLILYAVLLVGFVALIALILQAGGAAHPVAVAAAPAGSFAEALKSPFAKVLMQILAVVLFATFIGTLFERFGQPRVIGEMTAGIALGPSVFGALSPSAQAFIFPTSSLGTLSMLSQIGIVLFLFVVGMELDTKLLKKRANSAILISHMSIVVPFLLGTASALWLYNGYGGNVPFAPFALFMGISMSITAFPVLARIIQERGLRGTDLGNTAITCAAVDDVTAWCGLAFIVAMATSQSLMHAALTVVLTIGFFVLVIFLIRPMLQRMADRLPDITKPDKGEVVVCLATLFFCAFTTEAIGIHALFGAFLAGVAMPRHEVFRTFLRHRLEYFSGLFLLPIFFAFTGLRTQIGLLNTPMDWAVCAGLLAIAIIGKFGGSMAAARITGMSWRDSAAIGALMNTRGLVELIVLNLGLDLGILTPKVFSMLVLMALITTFATGPIIDLLGIGSRAKRHRPEIASDQALEA